MLPPTNPTSIAGVKVSGALDEAKFTMTRQNKVADSRKHFRLRQNYQGISPSNNMANPSKEVYRSWSEKVKIHRTGI
jgi:hypothetical protein